MNKQLPEWVSPLLPVDQQLSPEGALALSIEIAVGSARNKGGPFGAVLLNENGELITIGWNNVVLSHDSTAHAEIDCIRRAQQKLNTHDLKSAGEYLLYSSTAPCIQCFGALWWAGISKVIVGAPKESAEQSGFDEGPVSDSLWREAKARKGIEFQTMKLTELDPSLPFIEFEKAGGVLY